MSISYALPAMRQYFRTGATQSLSFRKEQLQKLKRAILHYEQELHDALYTDLKKSPEESWITETGFLLNEINYTLRNLDVWMSPQKTGTNLLNFPSASYLQREPLGVTLIIAPWNYPLQLLLVPLVGSIAAGNCTVIKASEFAPATAAMIKKITEENFAADYILYTEGDGATVVPGLLNNFRFDHIFYTGSTQVGKIIYKMAADQLTPVTLELGGKSPCVIEKDANLKVAARRIAMTKFSNAGQMCIAVDYILVQETVKEAFVTELKKAIRDFFTDNPAANDEYGKIINARQFDRLIGYLGQGEIIYGGNYNKEELYIAPTLMVHVPAEAPLMKEEIFGPLLPVLAFTTMEEALAVIDHNPDPLAFYIYTGNAKKAQQWIDAVPSGNACVNNSSMHATNHHLPFGGRGNSGIGAYHGRKSFEIFSHLKGVLKTPTWFDPAFKYPPFKGKLKWLKWLSK